MSDIPAVKAQELLTDALAILEPEINGLTKLAGIMQGEPDEVTNIQTALILHVRRRDLLTAAASAFAAAASAWAALEVDGFPRPVAKFGISAESLKRITDQVVEIASGAKAFEVKPPSEITGDLAGAVVTEQPAPTEQAP